MVKRSDAARSQSDPFLSHDGAGAARARFDALLSYDYAVLGWLDGRGPLPEQLEIPSDDPRFRRETKCLSDAGDIEPGRASRTDVQLAGFDEAGRGALAGPVVVGCVHLDLHEDGEGRTQDLADALVGVDDSKRLSPSARDRLFDRITEAAAWGVGASSAAEIDRCGIVAACRLAAHRAFRNLGLDIDLGLFDRGLSLRGDPAMHGSGRLPLEATSVRADGRSLHVACASIVAKVWRDRRMCRLSATYPGYAIERHKGYGTAVHRDAIRSLGPTSIHRRTFLKGCESAKSQSC